MKLKGLLLSSNGTFFIRQYTQDGEFRDIRIKHDDLNIEIDDDSAQMRQDAEGNYFIDYDDATLWSK